MLNAPNLYSRYDCSSARCPHNTKYSLGNPPKWKCVECSVQLINDSRVPLLSKYSAIDELSYAAENKLDFDKILNLGQEAGPKLARVLIDFSMSNLVLEEYVSRIRELIITILEYQSACQQRQYIISHLLMKINNMPLSRQQGPSLCLFVLLIERFSGSEMAINPAQVSHLLDKLICYLLEPDPSTQALLLKGTSTVLQHWTVEILSEFQLTRLTSALIHILDHSGSQVMYSQSFILFSTLFQRANLRAPLCRTLSSEYNLKTCLESVKKLVLTTDADWQTSGLQFLFELISMDQKFLEFCLKSDMAEYMFECSGCTQQDSTMQLVLTTIATFCNSELFFSQMHHFFAIQPLNKILNQTLESNAYHNVIKTLEILTRIFQIGPVRGPVVSREGDLKSCLVQIKKTVGHHNSEIATLSTHLFSLLLRQEITSSIKLETEALIVMIFREIQEKLSSINTASVLKEDNYTEDRDVISLTFENYFSLSLSCELSGLKVVFVREIKQRTNSDSKEEEEEATPLKDFLLAFYEQYILPNFLRLLFRFSHQVVTYFSHITLELISNISQSVELVIRLVESSLLQNLWNLRLQRNDEEMEMSLNHLIKQLCCVLVREQEEREYVSEYIDSFLALRSSCTFSEVTKHLVENMPSRGFNQQATGFIAILYLLLQRSAVELVNFNLFLVTFAQQIFPTGFGVSSGKLNKIIVKHYLFLSSYLSNCEESSGLSHQPNPLDVLIEQLSPSIAEPESLYTHHTLLIRLVYYEREPCLVELRRPFLRLWFTQLREMADLEADEYGDLMITLILAFSELRQDICQLNDEFEVDTRTGLLALSRKVLKSDGSNSYEGFLKRTVASLEHNLTMPWNERLGEEINNNILELLVLAYQFHTQHVSLSIKLAYHLINLILNEKSTKKTLKNAIDLINLMLKTEAKVEERQILSLTVGHEEFLKSISRKDMVQNPDVFENCAFLLATLINRCGVVDLKFPIELVFEEFIEMMLDEDVYPQKGALNIISQILVTRKLSIFQEFQKEKFSLVPSRKLIERLCSLVFLLYNLMVDADVGTQENATSCLVILIDCAYSFNWDDKILKELFTNKWNDCLLEMMFLRAGDIEIVAVTYYCKKLITSVYSKEFASTNAIFNEVYKLFTTVKLDRLTSLAFYDFFRESIPHLEAAVVRDNLKTICDTFELVKQDAKVANHINFDKTKINSDQLMPLSHALSANSRGIEISALRMNL